MKTIYFLPVLLISVWCKAQNGVYPYAEKNKWGLTNRKHAVIAEPQYDSIHLFNGDYARIENNKKVGLIHTSGKVVYACNYADMPFVAPNGMAVARLVKGYVLLDPATGKQKGSLVFDEIPGINPMSRHTNLLLVKKEGYIGVIDMSTGDLVNKKLKYDDGEFFEEKSLRNFMIVGLDGKYGVADAYTGKEIIPATYSEVKGITDGTQDFIKAVTEDERTVYFDATGKVTSAAAAKAAEVATEAANHTPGSFASADGKKDLHIYKLGNNKWRIVLELTDFQRRGQALDSVDLNGYSQIEYMSYREQTPKYQSKLKAVKDGKTGVIDMKGNVLVPLIYDDVTYREDNIGHYAFIETKVGNRIGVIPAETMQELKKPVLVQIIDEDQNRQAFLVKTASGTRGYMDQNTGEVFIPGYKD
ncbi:WG repeat-containing protein [Chitinophaga rhizophila]|uniref:WG repeat-containing protein n=1 Tax=Chitinophaga rhizophila TaxID=2866212 RepID=A0ABS7GBB5_9BACT|nr:WG repeat-containing protein [Chitinophaga rhizophila]MBW8684979.1 WG repeat-containing protein [Chitinophaga rhizophila]